MGGGRFDLQNLSSSIHLPHALNAFTLLCQMLQAGGGGGGEGKGKGRCVQPQVGQVRCVL